MEHLLLRSKCSIFHYVFKTTGSSDFLSEKLYHFGLNTVETVYSDLPWESTKKVTVDIESL